jgi:Zn-dependent protease
MFWRLINPQTNTFFIQVASGVVVSVQQSFLFWIIVFVGLLVSIAIHEFSHALSAHLLGDPTPKLEDRLTLNPFKHFDVYGFFLILFTFFGYGKPVNVNPYNFKNPVQGNFLVALAGPASNIVQAAVYGILFLVLREVPVYQGDFKSIGSFAQGFLTTLIYALPLIGFSNITLALFNLLPIPPLDGSKIWGYVHYKVDDFINVYIAPYALFIMLVLVIPIWGDTSLLSMLFQPIGSLYFSLIS